MLTLIALSTLLTQTPPAPPSPPGIHGRVIMMGPGGPASLDKDGDGQVSRAEFTAPMNDHFARLDANGDGRLSEEELSGGEGPGAHHWVHRSDGDGEARTMVFTRGSGEAGPRIEREVIIRGPGGAGGPHMMRSPGHDATGNELRFEFHHDGGPGGHGEMDKDGDGRISEAEFIAPLRDAFARMDADRSGYIEAGERGSEGDVRVFTHRIETRGED
ncbi:hypothetical protein GCM10009116_08730 [Brevundimonas basaltis]|uniref:EF-hand domain-containing protein n=1 Tax=Brevundimonas basaltis TaxID=472166 RepID=A0A7W8MGQ9_9CAUL|nr:EF-hand domain-containing protein [Brevundimonas basaltis]MBB5292200.1 hypothetical protein [Brevundimonas basaltis]